MNLTVIISTHNRAGLLARVLTSLNECRRPEHLPVDILVVANACSDPTVEMLKAYTAEMSEKHRLPLRWIEEPRPGKSYALNFSLRFVSAPWIALVDDDHRIDPNFLQAAADAIASYPGVSIFSGRTLPDWDGSEPYWIRDQGPYRIYPSPIPQFDLGETPCPITLSSTKPGGGNLVLKGEVFDRIGGFSTDLGPKGHDLLGSEDTEFLQRAMASGIDIYYIPALVQFHYVDRTRLQLGYILKKSYQRSRSIVLVKPDLPNRIPVYLWKKIALYMAQALFSLRWDRTRYFLVRLAATLGELHGFYQRSHFILKVYPQK